MSATHVEITAVIHDDELCGIMMIPLLSQIGAKVCQIRECQEKPSAIIHTDQTSPFAICEKHYQEFKQSGTFHHTVDF